MAQEKHCVFRSDLLSGTDVAADLVSLRVYQSKGGEQIDCDNGLIVELQGYEDNQREVMIGVPATSASKMEDCAIVASVEMMYDERKKNLDEFYNEKGTICRGYIPREGNMYSITKEGISSDAPSKGDKVGLDTGGKLSKAQTGWGEIMAVETTKRYTYYVVRIRKGAAE